ncbi:unnamed protein product [Gulo gulo]|uniref:Uncharacterized protein n=1 Tax=Gulo gulo TaxID=48420 RepID=A0A9X9LQI1_GULGU|nr:unnamed protein product [Gulo gulo]
MKKKQLPVLGVQGNRKSPGTGVNVHSLFRGTEDNRNQADALPGPAPPASCPQGPGGSECGGSSGGEQNLNREHFWTDCPISWRFMSRVLVSRRSKADLNVLT